MVAELSNFNWRISIFKTFCVTPNLLRSSVKIWCQKFDKYFGKHFGGHSLEHREWVGWTILHSEKSKYLFILSWQELSSFLFKKQKATFSLVRSIVQFERVLRLFVLSVQLLFCVDSGPACQNCPKFLTFYCPDF